MLIKKYITQVLYLCMLFAKTRVEDKSKVWASREAYSITFTKHIEAILFV